MNVRSPLYPVCLPLCFECASLHLPEEYLALNINCLTSITELFPVWMSHLTNNTNHDVFCDVCLLPVLRANRHSASQVWSFFLPRAFDFHIVVLPSRNESAVPGRLGCFVFFPVINNILMRVCICKSLPSLGSMLLGSFLEAELVCQKVDILF